MLMNTDSRIQESAAQISKKHQLALSMVGQSGQSTIPICFLLLLDISGLKMSDRFHGQTMRFYCCVTSPNRFFFCRSLCF